MAADKPCPLLQNSLPRRGLDFIALATFEGGLIPKTFQGQYIFYVFWGTCLVDVFLSYFETNLKKKQCENAL